MKVRILVADDIPESRKAIVTRLRTRFDVIAEQVDGTSALDAIRECRPDVAVLDLSMPELNGIQVTREAVNKQPRLAVLICSVHRDSQLIQAAAEAGALGYVAKVDMFRDLLTAVDTVAAGLPFFPPGVQPRSIPTKHHKPIP